MSVLGPIHGSVPRKWGLRMDGVGGTLEDLIRQQCAVLPSERVYTLIEVGSAGCVSLRAFSDILCEARGDKWRTIGLDLPLGKAWSVDMNEVHQSFVGLPWQVMEHDTAQRWLSDLRELSGMSLLLLDDPRAFVRDTLPYAPDFTFIDGSHGISCGRDFLAVEHKVPTNGLVVFHDYGEAEQGTDFQSFDREFISVRSYVHRLGLAAPCNAPRRGWRFIGEIKGSRHWGGDGNSAAVVQRTAEPLQHQPELSLD